MDQKIASGGKYVFSYREALKNQFEKDSVQATAMGVFAPVSKNLENFETDLYRAQTKDKIASLISASENNTDLLGLVAEYTDDGGFLDKCTSSEVMDTEYKRASVRIAWYREYASCRQSIEDILYLPAKDISDRLTKYAKENIKTLEDFRQYNREKSKRYYEKNRERVIARNKANYRKKIEELKAMEEKQC